MVSIVDNRLFLHRNRFLSQATRCAPQSKNQNHYCHTDNHAATQILRLSNLLNIALFKLLSILHVHSWYSDLSLRLWGPWFFDVIECLDNFLCFSMCSRTSPFRKHSVLFFSVGLPRTVCAFVSLTRDNMMEQYINTFPETPRPNGIRTASHCCFEKIRIKRYPNRPSLDHPLDLTKSTNHKKWT